MNLRASTAAFAKDLDKALQLSFNSAREMERSFKILGQAAVGAFTGAAVGLAGLVAHSIETAAEIGRLSQATGLSVEQFSGLAFAAKQTGAETQQLAKGLVTLSKNLEKSNQQTLEGKAAHSALATLFRGNIPVFKSTDEAFLAIADRLARLPESFEKTAIRTHLFAKSAIALAPLLNEGAKGIEALREEAKKLGLVLDSETIESAEKFERSLKQLKSTAEGLGNSIAKQALPALVIMSQAALGFAKSGDKLRELGNAFAALTSGPGGAGALAGQLGFLSVAGATASTILEKDKDSAAAAAVAAEAAAKAHARLKEALTSVSEKLSTQITEFTLGSNAVEIFRLRTLGATSMQLKFVQTLQTMVQRLKDGKNALTGLPNLIEQSSVASGNLDDSWSKLFDAGQKLWLETRTSIEKYALKQLEVNEIIKAFPQFQDAANRELFNYGVQLGLVSEQHEKLRSVFKRFQTEIVDGFTEAIIGARSFSDVLKGLIVDLERVILKELVFKSIANSLGGAGGFLGFLGSFFSGFKASGGPVSAGQSYVVGEQGPEIFSPMSSGTIIPNSKVGGTVNYYIDARGTDPVEVERRVRRAIAESESRAVQKSVLANRDQDLRTA